MEDVPGDFMDFPHIKNLIIKEQTDKIHEFNLMLVGKSNVGKSTLVKSLFKGKIKPIESNQGPKLCQYSELLEENGVRLQLTCVETSNFKMHNIHEYVKFVDDQFKAYFKGARRHGFKNIRDTRIHCCLYLIPAHDSKLDKEDIECMKALHEKVPLVPIIVKADILDNNQKLKLKDNIMRDLESNGIKYFQFEFPKEEDEERHNIVKAETARFPFAVVAADEPTYDKQNNKINWLRRTGAGVVDILDTSKSDFLSLAKLLIRHCMVDLIDATFEIHYAKFKKEFLSQEVRFQNLKSIGMEKHEIEFIEYSLNPKAHKPFTIHDMRKDKQRIENELLKSRLKIKHLRLLKERNVKGL